MVTYTKKESNYDFVERHFQVFTPHRRNLERQPSKDELLIDEGWRIALPREHSDLQERAAADLQTYLRVSQDLSITLQTVDATTAQPRTILFLANQDKHGFTIEVARDSVTVTSGSMDHLFAAVRIEDVMNFAEAPILPLGKDVRSRLIEVKEVHSACADDEYPEEELNAMAHAGYNCIVEFMTAPDRNRHGYCDLPGLIKRAAKYGILVTAYNYMKCWKHPDEPGAQEAFDAVFGEFARRNPGLHRIKLCGESLEFPSRDPHTTGKLNRDSKTDGIPDPRPSPGWYPCSDYPAYLARIEKAVHKYDPDVDVVMSTYNWGYLPAEERRDFVFNLPKGISLELVYDIFGKRSLGDLKVPIMDYSYALDDASQFFMTEGANAKAAGRPAKYANVNTTGNSWDIGCVPYIPVPYRLIQRFNRLEWARKEWGLNEHYCCHHQGWSDSFCVDLSKGLEWSPRLETAEEQEALLRRVAVRDYGKSAADAVMKAWRAWSSSMSHYVGSNEDQYGPWRVGAAYPFIFQPDISRTFTRQEIDFPTAERAHNGFHIIKTFYHPYENTEQSPGFLRFPREIEELKKMREQWNSGLAALENCDNSTAKDFQKDAFERLYALGHFIRNAINTTINIKNWWLLNMKLQTSASREEALAVLDRLEELARQEIANAEDTIPDAERDSRIGWEPSMEYVADRWHLEWKIRQMQSCLREIEIYRGIVKL